MSVQITDLQTDLINWLETNRLNYSQSTDHIFTIQDVGRFVVIEGENGLIVDENFQLVVSEEDDARVTEALDQGDVDYYAFQFGKRWYYTSTPEVNLTELRYLGIEKDNIEPFPFLGVHGGYDLCNGSRSYKDWCKKAKFCNSNTLGIAEENTLAGTLEFQTVCLKEGIKPIIGETVTVKCDDGSFYSVKLYVEDVEGWKNLLMINSHINVHNEDKFVSEVDLIKHSKGLICVISPEAKLNKIWAILDMSFHNKLYYQIDVSQWSSSQRDDEWLNAIQLYIKEYKQRLKPVIIQDAYYLEKDDSGIRKDLNAIGKVSFRNQSSDQYYKTPSQLLEQLMDLFNEEDFDKASDFVCEAIDNAKVIGESQFLIETGKLHLPKYQMTEVEMEEYEDNTDMLYALIQSGMYDKGLNEKANIDEYLDRIEKEMNVICEAKLQDYFLITWDILNWCRSQGIMTGYGRGSAAGCLVAYLLGIVQVDPLEYDLLFERFLNEGRLYKKKKVKGYVLYFKGERIDSCVNYADKEDEWDKKLKCDGYELREEEVEIKVTGSMPDIDNDIAGERREEVKRYIENKYGANRVAGIGTYGALKIKSALNDLARRSGIQQGKMAYVTGAISDDSLEYYELFQYALGNGKPVVPVKDFIHEYPELIEKLPLLLNQPKTSSSHAAGLIIVPDSPNGIFEQLPVKKMDGILVSEWEMGGVEQAGFLKLDLLGLKQLDKFAEILELIEKHKGKKITLSDIPLDDPKVYEYFALGYNEDVFQFGGAGLKGYTRDLQPEGIEDLIATVALYRPGPIEMKAHIDYVKRKNGGEISYPFGTEKILNNTYGLLVYQEQVQKIMSHVAGFTPNEADDVRKAMGKKIPELMKGYRTRFLEGAVANGCDQKEAEQMWSDIEGFAAYSFNKSHATCYAITGYYCQWLKVNYPLEFWLVSLKHSKDDQMISRLAEMSLTGQKEIGGPNINKSTDAFTTDGEKIYWSLKSVKQVGERAMEDILKLRENGEFFSVTEFTSRAKGTAIKKNSVINLILAGAFDELHKIDEKSIRGRFSILKEYLNFINSDDASIEEMDKWENYQWILKQREVCGLGMINVKALLSKVGCTEGKKKRQDGKIIECYYYSISDVLATEAEELRAPIVGGVIVKVDEKVSKKKAGAEPFAIIDISDGISTLSGVMWSDDYKTYKDFLQVNKLLFLKDVWIKYDNMFKKANTFMVTSETKIAIL